MTRSRSTLLLCLAHLIGNAWLLLLGYYWLGLGESDALHLLFSAAVILLLALASVWLHGTAFVLFRREVNLPAAALRALRHLPPLFLLSLGLLLFYVLLHDVYDSFGHQAFTIGSYATLKLRRPVAPDNVLKTFHFFIWLLEWVVVPAFVLPLASEVANRGWPGFHRVAFIKTQKPLFWLQAGILLVAAIHLPLHLFLWIPKVSSFSMQVVSVSLRLGLGYLLFTAGLLAVEFFTSAGKPRATQLNTVVSP